MTTTIFKPDGICKDCNKQKTIIKKYNRCFDCAVAFTLNQIKAIETAKQSSETNKNTTNQIIS